MYRPFRAFGALAVALLLGATASSRVPQAFLRAPHDHWMPKQRGGRGRRARKDGGKYARGVFAKVDRSKILPPRYW